MIDDRHDGEGGRERDVAGRALLRIDHLADDERRRADDLRDDVVAERQREGEDRAGDDARRRQRQDHMAKRLARRSAPRSADASIRLTGTRSSAACTGRIMKGIQT